MRYSKTGTVYVSTADELVKHFDESDFEQVSAGPNIDPPDEVVPKYTTEVRDDESGETLCFVEAESEAEVRAILSVANVPFVE